MSRGHFPKQWWESPRLQGPVSTTGGETTVGSGTIEHRGTESIFVTGEGKDGYVKQGPKGLRSSASETGGLDL